MQLQTKRPSAFIVSSFEKSNRLFCTAKHELYLPAEKGSMHGCGGNNACTEMECTRTLKYLDLCVRVCVHCWNHEVLLRVKEQAVVIFL